jgi:hypothetical protein
MTPAEVVIGMFGGTAALAEMLGITRQAVNHWNLIPAKYHRQLLRLACERGLWLTADDLIWGRNNGTRTVGITGKTIEMGPTGFNDAGSTEKTGVDGKTVESTGGGLEDRAQDAARTKS